MLISAEDSLPTTAHLCSEWLTHLMRQLPRDEIFYHELLARLGLPHALKNSCVTFQAGRVDPDFVDRNFARQFSAKDCCPFPYCLTDHGS